MNDQWLNQMEMSTYTPDVAPMWARPDISKYEIQREGKGGGDGGGGAEKSSASAAARCLKMQLRTALLVVLSLQQMKMLRTL